MKNYIDDELNDAINTLEVLINSEHKDLMLDVLSSYVRNKSIDKVKMQKVSTAIKNMTCK
ncbi:MAG: hypothetical protein AB1782_18460 [Cyanobacteriota bacterium]